MEAEKVMNSVKDWGRNRLNNPYFASVLVVWLYTNRIEVFGLFNFNDSQTIQDRVLWMQQQFHNKEIHSYFDLYIWKGFSGVVWFSLLVGIGTMLVFTYAQAISEVIYDKVGQYAVSIRAWNKPLKWVSLEKHEEMSSQFESGKTNLIKRNQEKDVELIELREGKAVDLKSIVDLTSINSSLGAQNALLMGQNAISSAKANENDQLTENEKVLSEEKSKKIILLETEKKLLVDQKLKLEAKARVLKNEFEKKENRDLAEIERETNLFLVSDYVKYFEGILGKIRNHKIIGDSVPSNVLDYYHSKDLIELKDNLYIITPKGNEYYKKYLNRIKYTSET